MNEFWMVWGENSRIPVKKHASLEQAKREAVRLSALNPGQRFFVLETAGHAIRPEGYWVPVGRDDGIPF